MTRLTAFLRLARISNLPTVWSNVLAASVLAGGMGEAAVAQVIIAMSLLYTGGMFLNDAFDKRIDARERPERPLPSGTLSSAVVWASGLAMLGSGFLLLAAFGLDAALAAVALVVAILLYDAWHKGNPIAPFVMGLCRALVYVGTVVCAAVPLTLQSIGASAALLAYVAGLTFSAQQESFGRVGSWWPLALLVAPVPWALVMFGADWRTLAMTAPLIVALITAIAWLQRQDVKRAVSLLIAAIALVDATFAASAGNTSIALICCALFALTLLLQRFIPGT